MPKVFKIEVVTGSNDGWMKLIHKNLLLNEIKEIDKLVVDFRPTRFLEPLHLVSLACLIEQYHLAQVDVEFIRGRYGIDKYLRAVNFYDYWTDGFNRNVFADPKNGMTLPIWKIAKPKIQGYTQQAQYYFEQHHFAGQNLEAIAIALPELFTNITEHAKSIVDGYVVTQYYPGKNEISIAVCDFGKGIPNKVNEIWQQRKKRRLSDEDALRAAFTRHVSSKPTSSDKGAGLSKVYDMVKALNGEMMLYSNKAFLKYESGNGFLAYNTNHYFAGTLIQIVVKTDHLPERKPA